MKVVLASNNAGKVSELQYLLKDINWEVVPQSDFGIPPADETAPTFVENALLKARHAARLSGLPAIADDSGLEVDFLKGAPGILSARFAGSAATDSANNNKLLSLLEGVPTAQRNARFQCVVVYLRHADDPTPLISQGTWEGRIAVSPRGKNGFGYDPLFFDPILNRHSAELEPALKNQMSHRAKALAQFKQQLQVRS